MFTPSPPPYARSEPPLSKEQQYSFISEESDGDFDMTRKRAKGKGRRYQRAENSETGSKDSSLPSLDDRKLERTNSEFDDNRKRILLKGKQKKLKTEEIPSKSNAYLRRRMSDVLRGDDPALPDIDELLFNIPEKMKASDFEPRNFFQKVEKNILLKMSEKKILPRILICAIAVALLWASSATACKKLVQAFIPIPQYSDVKTSAEDLYAIVIEEREAYEVCVQLEFAACNSTYNNHVAAELKRVNSILKANQVSLNASTLVLDTCSDTYNEMIAKLVEYASATVSVNSFLLSSSNTDCSELSEISASQLQALAATETSEQAGQLAVSTITAYESALNGRISYDEAFVYSLNDSFQTAYNKLAAKMLGSSNFSASTAASFGELQACLGNGSYLDNSTNVTYECSQGSVGSYIDNIIEKYESCYENIQSLATIYINAAEEMMSDVERIQKIFADIPNLDSLGIDLSILDFPELDLSEIYASFYSGLDSLGIDADYFNSYLDSIVSAFKDNLTDAAAQFDSLEAEIQAKQDAFLQRVQEEYSAPGVDENVTLTSESAITTSNNLAAKIAEDLSVVDFDFDDLSSVTNLSVIVNNTGSNLIQGLADRPIEWYSYPAEIFENIETSSSLLLDLILAFDTTYRVLKSFLLIKKYWNISAIAAPYGDVTTGKGKLFKEKKDVLQKFAKVMSHPLIEMVFTVGVLMALTLLFYFIYIPVFNEYVSGCSDNNYTTISNGEGNGTMIYRNLLTMTKAYCYASGDSEIADLVDRLNLERTIVCSDNYYQSADTLYEQNTTYLNLVDNMKLINTRYKLFAECVDWDSYQAASDANSSIDPLSYTFKAGFGVQSCHEEVSAINLSENSTYSCSNVASCEEECNGPNTNLLEKTNWETACLGEYMLHSYFLTALFATTMFICLNFARNFFMNGLVEVFWPSICCSHSYLCSCTERGTIIPPVQVEKGELFEEVIKKALDKSLRKFTFKGYLDLCYAVLINLPWIVFIVIISKGINYEELSF